MERGMSAFKILKVTPSRKRPLGKPRRRWEDNIRMEVKELGVNTGIGLVRFKRGIIGEPL